jgi:hypothetical protein
MKYLPKLLFLFVLLLKITGSFSQEYYYSYAPADTSIKHLRGPDDQYLHFINDSVFTISDIDSDSKIDTMKVINKDWYLMRNNAWYEFYTDSKRKPYSSLEGFSAKAGDMNYIQWLGKEKINGVLCSKFKLLKSNLTNYDFSIVIHGYFNPKYGIVGYLFDNILLLRSDISKMGSDLPILSSKLSYHYSGGSLRRLHSFTQGSVRFEVKFVSDDYKIKISDITTNPEEPIPIVERNNSDAESTGVHQVLLPRKGIYLVQLTKQDGQKEFTVIQIW